MVIDYQKLQDDSDAVKEFLLEEGIGIGREEGREEGIEIGEEKKSQENILNLLEYGLSIEEIAKALKLPLEEVEQITKEL